MSEHFYVYPHVSSLFLDGVLYDYTGSEIVHHVMVNGAFLKTCSASRSTKCAVADAGILLEISSSQVQSLQRGVSPGSTLIACSFSDAGMSSCIATKLSSSTGVIILESIGLLHIVDAARESIANLVGLGHRLSEQESNQSGSYRAHHARKDCPTFL